MKQSKDEEQIRALVARWVEAVCKGDIDAIVTCHTEDVVMFDVPAPLQLRGIDAYRKAWELYFSYTTGGEGTFAVTELELFVGSDVAYAHSPLRVAGGIARLTLGFRKAEDGTWRIAHEHHSFAAEIA